MRGTSVPAYKGFERDVKLLYGKCRIYGPYVRKVDHRKIVLLYFDLPKKKIKRTCKLYAKIKLEIKLGRLLTKEETVDHIDENCLNDKFNNLQLLTREENSRKSAIGNSYSLGFKQNEEQKRNGEKNGQARVTNAQVEVFRINYANGAITQKQIQRASGLKEKAVRNLLTGISFTRAGGPLSVLRAGRPRR